jgi:tetratricopeptide (TPR) repeat protein
MLSQRAAELYNRQFGARFTAPQINRLIQGSYHEDIGVNPYFRSTNHFYDVHNQREWRDPVALGLGTYFLSACFYDAFKKGNIYTAKEWALNPSYQQISWETWDIAYAIRLVQDALDFYPNEVFFSALCSNLLNDKGEHDRAMDFKLRSLQRDGGPSSIFPEAELEHCTTAYQEAYAQKVRDALSESGVRQYIDNYALQSDIGTLWKRKLYSQIAELFKFVKPSINNYQEIGEMREYIGGGGLFEIAYALSETGDLNEALQTYEKAAEPDWDDAAILNNIAIVYEKKGDLKKAKEMIVKAKSLSPDDEVVLNNYRRMFADGKDAGNDKPRSETRVPKPKKEKLSFDMATGEISFGNKKCEIPIGTNQYQLCKALFTQPLGEWLKETDVVEEFYRGKESRRAFYDAIRLTNQKVEQGLKIRKLLAYDAARVKIRT